MKNKLDLVLLAGFMLSLPVCVWAWFSNMVLLLFITVVPFFCLQLLLCRLTGSLTARLVPVAPVLLSLAGALFYTVRDSGWDRLAALIFALASIAPAAGLLLGWLVWWLMARR